MTKEDIHQLRMKNDTSLASLINENLSNAGNLIFNFRKSRTYTKRF